MAKFKFVSETEQEENLHLYTLQVTSNLGEDDERVSEHTVVFNPDEAHDKAQEYADQVESELKAQKESESEE